MEGKASFKLKSRKGTCTRSRLTNQQAYPGRSFRRLEEVDSDSDFGETMGDIQDYFSKRAALIHEDKSLRRENNLLQSLTKNELAADKIVRHIRAEEAASIWGVERDEFPHLFPGMEFLTCMYSGLDYARYGLLARSETHNRSDENLQDHLQGMQCAFPAIVSHV